jgi:hypothetical protein
LLPLVLKGLLRSKTRLAATTGCCLIAAAIVAFFLTAEHSLNAMLRSAGDSANLVMTQKDRY